MTTPPDDLYEQDFYAWTRAQAKALRALAETRPNAPVDWPHLIEEVRDLGSEQRYAVESQLERLMEHLLKLQYSTAESPRRGWMISCISARGELERRLSASMRPAIRRRLPKLYARARRTARLALEEHGEQRAADALPETCPYSLAQLTDDSWWPERGAP